MNEKYDILFDVVKNLEMRDIRAMFLGMRQIPDHNPNFFFPSYGFTAGEFSTAYVTTMPERSKLKKQKMEIARKEQNENDTSASEK
jgi:hypothetical protein